MTTTHDVLIVGAGAAGLFCAGVCAQLGLKVALLDHSEKVAEKIRISGGGRCNFTNKDMDPAAPDRHFFGKNPRFARSALVRYTPAHFMDLLRRHGVGFHEKHKGQLFCDDGSPAVIRVLQNECSNAAGGSVQRFQPCRLHQLTHHDGVGAQTGFTANTDAGPLRVRAVVVATGGLSIPATGATGLGYELAQQFGLAVEPTRPGLVPLTMAATDWAPYAELSGLSFAAHVQVAAPSKAQAFEDDVLITHRGLSGPAILQISNAWLPGQGLQIHPWGDESAATWLFTEKRQSRLSLLQALSQRLPQRLAQHWTQDEPLATKPLTECPDRWIRQISERIQTWNIKPAGTLGYGKAEVTLGGVSTRALSQQTMESQFPGLYFIGEVTDITGWLGGYNFQWAWASAHAAAQGLAAKLKPL
jgi:predicted Rossmann fold flavoprotein